MWVQYIVQSIDGAVASLFVGLLHRSLLPPAGESSVSIQPHYTDKKTSQSTEQDITSFIIKFILKFDKSRIKIK